MPRAEANRAARAFVLCADDYALAPGVSRGILEALEAGALSATSAMTNSPWWQEHAGALRRFGGRSDLGLHLTLTCGRPLTPMRRLAPNGAFPSLGGLMARAGVGEAIAAEIEQEIAAQFDAFVAAMGGPPDHVDGHQHVHVLPAIRRPLLAALRGRGWRPWLRDSGDSARRILLRRSAPAKALGVAVLASGLRGAAAAAGLETNQGFAGFARFDARDSYGTLFERFLVAPGPRHLVMCHPGYADAALRRLDPVVATREGELAFLLSPAFREALGRAAAAPATMAAVIAAVVAAAGR